MKYFIFFIFITATVLNADVYLKVSNKEFSSILKNRLKNSIVEDIYIDDKTIKNVPFKVYKDNHDKIVARFIDAKNLFNYSDVSYENGYSKCMKDNDLLKKHGFLNEQSEYIIEKK